MSKKPKVDYLAMQQRVPSKQWKETPPGPEQKELERLFKSKLIKYDDEAEHVRKAHPVFSTFSQAVFSSHFRKTRAKLGMFTMLGGSGDSIEENFNDIPELGASGSSKLSENGEDSLGDEVSSAIKFVNPPYLAWTYTNHETKRDYVCVTLPIISGSEEVPFSVSEDGLSLRVSYKWLSAIYDPLVLFGEELKGRNTKIDDPKIHAMRSHLLKQGLTPKSDPMGSIIISLPKKVRREEGTFKKSAIELPDSNLIMLEFQAYQKNRIIDELDTSITFKKRA